MRVLIAVVATTAQTQRKPEWVDRMQQGLALSTQAGGSQSLAPMGTRAIPVKVVAVEEAALARGLGVPEPGAVEEAGVVEAAAEAAAKAVKEAVPVSP